MTKEATITDSSWLNIMRFHLAADYESRSSFYPIYSFDGRLLAVELMTHFIHGMTNVTLHQEMLLPQMENDRRILLLQDQINNLEKHHEFFRQRNINVALNVDEVAARILLDSDMLARRLALLKGVELEISESFTDFNLGRENISLRALSERFALSLHDYGSGKASSKAIYDNLFTTIKFDKGFIQQNVRKFSFRPFINATLEHIKPHCQQVIVRGIDDIAGLEKISHYPFDGIQSALFPSVSEDSLESLIHPPEAFAEWQF